MVKELLIGVNESGVMHTDADPPFDLDTKFAMAKESGVYDYFDKTPLSDQADDFLPRLQLLCPHASRYATGPAAAE